MRQSVLGILEVEGEFLFIKRQTHLNVFPGYTSFPGGKVDKKEKAIPESMSKYFSNDLHKVASALIRELHEELDLDVANSSVRDIKYLGKVITPDFNPVRFENFYFMISLSEKPKLNVDANEIAKTFWIRPQDLMAEYSKGEHLVVPPMLLLLQTYLENPARFPFEFKPIYDADLEVPHIYPIGPITQMLPLSHTFPPANRTNSFLIGDEKVVLVDPSPKDEQEFKKFLHTIKSRSINLVFLTHHHPDHHEFSVEIAKKLKVSMGMSEDTHQRILSKWGKDYFNGVDIEIFQCGDKLTETNGEKIFLLHTPGHDEGQLSIYSESLSWMIVSDLIQTVGTVVIGGPEGDMKKYFESLEKVISMNPKVVIPSHGIAMGGVEKIRVTLEHRKMRESKIKELLKDNKSEEEMLHIIYSNIDEKLFAYARKTICAHVKKIKDESNNS